MQCEQLSDQVSGTPSKCPETKRRFRRDGPDSAVSWCVAFAAFLINFIMAGLSRMSGILYVAFIEMFQTDRRGASMPFSVRSSTMNLLGPVVGILGQKYGVRWVSIVGGILGTLSSAGCFFANDINWITIIWGGINGVGTALVTTLTTVVVDQYFDKHRTTASGLTFSGACIGSFVFPPLIEVLLAVYGLEGSFLIVAAIIMHTIPAAMILRKPSWVKQANRKAKDLESAKVKTVMPKPTTGLAAHNNVNGIDVSYLRTNSDLVLKLLTADITQEKSEKCPPKDDILKEMEDVYTFVGKTPVSLRLSEVPPKLRLKFECETSPVSSKKVQPRTLRLLEDHTPVRKVHSACGNHSLYPQCKPFIVSRLNELYSKSESQIVSSLGENTLYTKVLKELRKLHKVYEAVKRRNIFVSTRHNVQTPKVQPKVLIPNSDTIKSATSNGLWNSIRNSVKLHANPLFLLVSLCRAIHFSTFIPVVTIIVDYMQDKGLMEEDGKYVIITLSMGDLFGRLCLGWVTDKGYVSLPKYMMMGMILQGVCTAVLPSMNTMITLLPSIAIYAMLQGSVFVRHNVLISKYMRKEEQSIAMGCVNFFAGILGFAVPAYVGFFRDTMGSYDGIFYCNGAIGAIVGLLWIFEPCFMQRSSDPPREVLQPNELKV